MSFQSGILPYKSSCKPGRFNPTGLPSFRALSSLPSERYARHPVRWIHFQELCLLLVHECGNAARMSALAINATHQRGRNVVMTQSDCVSELMSNDDGCGNPLKGHDNQYAASRIGGV